MKSILIHDFNSFKKYLLCQLFCHQFQSLLECLKMRMTHINFFVLCFIMKIS
jgi:hypothetical protein